MNALAALQVAAGSGSNRIRFVSDQRSLLGYEERIYRSAEVFTRPNNWHDLFNALVWMRFPKTKAALNTLHVELMRLSQPGAGRGPLRDAATQFDESGIVVISADPVLLDLLQARRWRELFWNRRERVRAYMRFLVFGHGLYDALRAPFYRICGRAALVPVTQALIGGDVGPQCEYVDRVLERRFGERTWYLRPRTLLALPLLGIPGVCAASECGDYYDDMEQFRPPPAESI